VTDPNNSTSPPARPTSPCINICSLDEDGICRGCYRTLAEIAAWTQLTAQQQWDVIGCLGQRASERGRKRF
jgi:predicted Fe-S protein YdhL (DUF1289 family)